MIDAERLAQSREFQRSDPAYFKTRLTVRLIWIVIFYGLTALAIVLFGSHLWWLWLIWAGILAIRLVNLALLRRRTDAFGYAETETELVLRRGLLVRNFEVIPYGRLQKVTLEEGPLLRKAGLASVTLVTASSDSDGSIPGVKAAEAERLREKLSRLGEANLEGL